jgi:hypothetical protein
VKESSSAQNDETVWNLLLAAGTWNLELLHKKGSDRGIYNIALDGNLVGTINGANIATQQNIRDSIAFTVPNTGLHLLRLRMATTSAGNYKGSISGLTLRRTA